MKRPSVFLQSGGSYLSIIVLTISLRIFKSSQKVPVCLQLVLDS